MDFNAHFTIIWRINSQFHPSTQLLICLLNCPKIGKNSTSNFYSIKNHIK